MSKLIKIPVPGEGLLTHDGTLKQVTMREPTFDEYLTIGEPVTLAQAPDKTLFQVENGEVIKAYIATCLVEPKSPVLLEAGGFRLARAVKGAVLGFFRDEALDSEPSKILPTISSSDVARDASTLPASGS